ncbi:Arabinanase/levansucrase/invertase, partial [Sarocladium strictum]
RWRPKFHIMASHGWMNDPCAPGYDSQAGLYHVNFQWNPHGTGWGNMSWGSATSPNMIDWTISNTPSMEPTTEQDQCGVFTGALNHQSKDQGSSCCPANGKLTAFYTSAQKLPINHRLPYTRGSEKLAIATSIDSGRTWQRDSQNIILAGPPATYDVISWRDPFIERWESIDRLIDPKNRQTHQYGIISGGVRAQTPAVFLYRIEPGPTPKWTFLSSLIDIGLNFCQSRWSGGDFGLNFEVTNFLTLKDLDGKSHDVLITSVEGRHEDPIGGELSKDHRQMWMSGPIERQDGGPRMKFQVGGALDHGCFYAANGFWDPLTGNFVTFGWIFEEDLPEELVERQGWSGCLSIPRIVVLKTWKNVVGTTRSQVSALTCFNSTKEANGTYTLQTVSLIPDPQLQRSRISDLTPQRPFCHNLITFPTAQSQLEIDLSFRVPAKSGPVGLDILHSPDGSEYTRIYFDSSSETVVIDRSQSTRLHGINVSPKQAPHTLFEFKKGEITTQEGLGFHVFFDTSVLEVFVNERVAITTRVYPQEGTCYGIRIYTGDDE